MAGLRNSLLEGLLIRIGRTTALCLLVALGALIVFQSRLIYHPQRALAETVAGFARAGGRRLDYLTGQGRQAAWLLPAKGGKAPEHLWIVCTGNGSQALDMADLQIQSRRGTRHGDEIMRRMGWGRSAPS